MKVSNKATSYNGRNEILIMAFGRLRQPLCNYISRRIGDSVEAEDMVQDIFETLLKGDRIISEATIDRYAYICARNLVTDWFRHHSCTERAREYFSRFSRTEGAAADEKLLYRDALECEREILSAVGEKGRNVWMMNIHEGLQVQEIAERMQISRRTAENHLFRVREKVRTQMRKIM